MIGQRDREMPRRAVKSHVREGDELTVTAGVRWLKVSEVAEKIGMHKDDVYRFIKNGELPAKRISRRRIRVSEHDLDEFMQTRQSAVGFEEDG